MSKIQWITITLKRAIKCNCCENILGVSMLSNENLAYIRIDDNGKQYTFCDKNCHDEWEHKNNILYNIYGDDEKELVFDDRPPVIRDIQDEKALNFT